MMNLEETLESGVDDAQRGGLKGRYAIEAWESNGMEKIPFSNPTIRIFLYFKLLPGIMYLFLGLYQYRY